MHGQSDMANQSDAPHLMNEWSRLNGSPRSHRPCNLECLEFQLHIERLLLDSQPRSIPGRCGQQCRTLLRSGTPPNGCPNYPELPHERLRLWGIIPTQDLVPIWDKSTAKAYVYDKHTLKAYEMGPQRKNARYPPEGKTELEWQAVSYNFDDAKAKSYGLELIGKIQPEPWGQKQFISFYETPDLKAPMPVFDSYMDLDPLWKKNAARRSMQDVMKDFRDAWHQKHGSPG